MSFMDQLQSAADTVDRQILETRRLATGRLFCAVVRDTPVLTGKLRSNWQPSVDDIPFGDVEIRSSSESVCEIWAVVNKVDDGRALFLTNNLIYGPRIEFDGWSSKAPEGMMRKNAAHWAWYVKEAAREAGL